jgi:hypothetical protein
LILGKEIAHLELIPVGNDPGALEYDKKIDAQIAEKAKNKATTVEEPVAVAPALVALPDKDLKN